MEKSGTSTTVRHQNPTFAILGLSHIGGRCTEVSEWSSSLSVSCFGGSNSTSADSADQDVCADQAPSPRPTRHVTDNAVVRSTLSAKASRWNMSANVDRRQSLPPPAVASRSTSLQVPSVSCVGANQRPSRGHPNRSSALSSESLVIRPLRGGTTNTTITSTTSTISTTTTITCSNSSHWPSTRRDTGSRTRTKTLGDAPARRDVLVLPPTTNSNNDEWLRGTSRTAGRHLDVFLPSLVVRQTVEPNE